MFSRKERPHKSVKLKRMEELVLPNAKLKFCVDQLQNLNFIFNKRLERSDSKDSLQFEKSVLLAKSVTERLVQRLLCGAAQIDPRFSCKYLISNRNDQNDETATHLEYIVRLDNLSTPLLYQDDQQPTYEILETDKDCPAGYARIRLQGATFKMWEEFMNSFGFLRRDRIQAKLVELLAQAASSDTPSSPLQVDESVMCGIPGKIVNPVTLHHILQVPASEQLFYGPGGSVPRFPDTRDFRLAIVDEPNGIKLKVEFLSPALSTVSIKVTILVAIGIDFWPASSDFPSRIPLGHSDCLLHYQAAQTISYKILNRYMLFTLLMEELEERSTTPLTDMVNWTPMYLSTMVLKLLDKAIVRLASEFQPNYFFKKANLLVNPGHLCDDDFIIEGNNIKNYLIRLFDESLMSNMGNDDFSRFLASQDTELSLLYKWRNLVEGTVPPSGTRARRLCFAGSKTKKHVAHTQYTTRQLEYIGLVLHNMLKVKQRILHPHSNNGCTTNEFDAPEDASEAHLLEDVIYVLVALLDQARDQYLALASPTAKSKAKIKANYSEYLSKLVDLLRKDKDVFDKNHTAELHDDLTLVKAILKWLYKAMDQNKKYFAPILRPYLNNVFSSSYHISYHMELVKERLKTDEMDAIGSFCKLVNGGQITPAQGLMDSLNKNWQWANDMLAMVERNTLRLVFVQERGKVYRHILSLPSYNKDSNSELESFGSKTWSDKSKRVRSLQRRSTLPGRNYFSTLLNEDVNNKSNSDTPQHEILKNNSPLTVILSKRHRAGQHRCAGDLLKTMAAMQKLSVFQEVASGLPKEEQMKLTNIIDNFYTAKAKRSLTKKWSSTLPHSSKITASSGVTQKYTPKEESAGIRISPEETRKLRKMLLRNESLLGTSRAARLREDKNVFLLQENFRIKSLLNRSESIK